ncbi:MAG: hypothetical protein CL484_12295 [Acidobacteria bacterium]|nr:hypothetical protein [Acidobacteriota bacterium]|tara:strand:- start:1625 stop:2089 length:465 start_codon:yes stop_codon:yes gene_type:complete
MKMMIAAFPVFVALLVVGVTPVAAQPQWSTQEFPNGQTEFRLRNDNGDSILLVCASQGLVAGFEFAEAIEPTDRAGVRGIPGERQNVSVSAVGDRILQLNGGRGLDFTLNTLRESATLELRAGDTRASFEVFGSASTVAECIEQLEDATQAPGR